jgi:aspartate kinase
VIVMKFGGTSVADRAGIERLMSIVRATRQVAIQPEVRDLRGPIVVVSALGGVTDRLLGVAAEAGAGDIEGARANLATLRARHIDVSGVVASEEERAGVEQIIQREFDELDRVVGALAVLGEVTPRWLDTIAAAGEILSSRIVAAALSSHGMPAAWIDPRTVMITTAEHASAVPLLPETTAALSALVNPTLGSRQIPVVGGFVGATPAGVVTTLGRGGSDYTAAIIGACLGATEIQIWTDVDGMLTADPRVVTGVRLVPHLSFAEASELAYFGAKVLHPSTIQPAVTADIPVRILNALRPEDAVGTLITRDRADTGRPLTAVASKRGVTVVDVMSSRMRMVPGVLQRIFEVFERHRTAVDVVATSEASVSVTTGDTQRLAEVLEALEDMGEVTREDDMAIVCAVGDGLRTDPSFTGQLLGALADIPVRMVSQAAARRNVTLVLREADLERALPRIHDRFFTEVPA